MTAKQSQPVSVFIAGSQRLVNKLICDYLKSKDGFSAAEGPIAKSIQLMTSEDGNKPDVVMLDNNSKEVADKLTNECEEYLGLLRGTPAIIFNFNATKRLKKWIAYGVRGIIYDQEAPPNLLKAVKTVAEGHMWFPRHAMTQYLTENISRKKDILEATENLTARELEILDLIAKGRSNDEIAERLFISPFTVKVHVQNIYRKIGVANRVKAVIWANENLMLNQ